MPKTTVLAHGGGSGGIDMLVGIAPVFLGLVMLGLFVVLMALDRRSTGGENEGVRDETPTSARQILDGEYKWSST